MILRSIEPFSFAKVYAVLGAAMGLLAGAMFSVLSLVGAFAAAQHEGRGWPAMLFGVGAIVILPVLYGVACGVTGLLMALFYNVTARFIGGVELDLVPKDQA